MTVFPKVCIETGRLTIREFEAGDAAGVTLLVAAQEWAALPPGAPREPAGVLRWLGDKLHRFRLAGLGLHLTIVDGEHGIHVGAMSLFNTDWRRGRVEIGYGVRSGLRGSGYATEALRALSSWALDEGGMRRIELKTDPANAASRRVAEKAGYEPEATVLDRESGREMLLFSRCRVAAATAPLPRTP